MSRTITHPVSRLEATLLLAPLTFCFDRLRTPVKTQLQCHPSQDASQSTKTICSILPQKEAGRLPPPAEAGGFRRQKWYERVRHNPELTWEQRKTRQNRQLYEEQPEWIWVLEEKGEVFGFITFYLFPQQGFGHIDNNGVHPGYSGRGWGKYVYQHVIQHFRDEGYRYAHVDTGLDPAHIPARRAYEAVGFDRQVPTVEYWQDLEQKNPGSEPE